MSIKKEVNINIELSAEELALYLFEGYETFRGDLIKEFSRLLYEKSVSPSQEIGWLAKELKDDPLSVAIIRELLCKIEKLQEELNR